MPDKWKNIHQQVLAGAIMNADRDPFIRENGETDWDRWECRPWYEADGSIGGMILYSENVNEQIQHENEIRELNSRLEILIDSIKELSSAHTVEAVSQIATQSSRKLVGSDGATFIVKDGENCFYLGENTVMPLWAGKRFPMSDCISGWVMSAHEPAVIEDIYTDSRVPIDLYRTTYVKSLIMVPVNISEPVGAIGNYWKENHQATDIEIALLQTLAEASSRAIENINLYAEREERIKQLKIKQQALAESESKYRLLAENSGDVIFVLDRNLKYSYISPAVKALRGFDPEEAMGQDIRDSMKPESYERAIKLINEYFNEDAVNMGYPAQRSIELELFRKDNSTVWAEIKASLYYDETNKPVGIIGVSRDISERRKAEEDLIKAKEKAEESDRLKTAFLQNISHEIRTPLNAIVGFSTLMGDDNMSSEKRKEFSEIIQTSNDQLLSVITGIISLASLEAGQEQCTETEADINEILKNIYDQLNISVIPGQVDFSYQTALPDNMATIRTDPVKLTQILLNLVSNALKFTHKGHVKYGYELANKVLKFYVEDTGIGIPADMLEVIFERFRQVDNSPTRRYGGAGLGLALSKGYTKLLGGTIEVASEPGNGTVFTLSMPYKPVGPEKPGMEEHSKTALVEIPEGKLILVAEDEMNNFLLVNEMLLDLNLQAKHARNGLEALSLCEGDELPDLVLMDIKMPVMDGIEARKALKEMHPHLKIVAMTAYALENDKEHFIAMGFDGYLEKPLKKQALEKTLSHLLKP